MKRENTPIVACLAAHIFLLCVGSPVVLAEMPGSEAQGAEPRDIAALVAELVGRAKADDATYFGARMDPGQSGQAEVVADMIRRSGMATNFAERCTFSTNGTARLDYHMLERRCHFQVDLVNSNGIWTARRFWFCR